MVPHLIQQARKSKNNKVKKNIKISRERRLLLKSGNYQLESMFKASNKPPIK